MDYRFEIMDLQLMMKHLLLLFMTMYTRMIQILQLDAGAPSSYQGDQKDISLLFKQLFYINRVVLHWCIYFVVPWHIETYKTWEEDIKASTTKWA